MAPSTPIPGGAQSTPSSASSQSGGGVKRGKQKEVGHYVVTAHRPGAILLSQRCAFFASGSTDVVVAKACRLEVRRFLPNKGTEDQDDEVNVDMLDADTAAPAGGALASTPFPVILDVPVRGRICTLVAFRPNGATTDFIFFSTERQRYAVISYSQSRGCIMTHDSGTLNDIYSNAGRELECGPMAAVDPENKCIACLVCDGYLKIFSIGTYRGEKSGAIGKSTGMSSGGGLASSVASEKISSTGRKVLGDGFNARIDHLTILSMTFLHCPFIGYGGASSPPTLCVLHQNSKGVQHVITHTVDVASKDVIQFSKVRCANIDSGARPPSSSDAAVSQVKVSHGQGRQHSSQSMWGFTRGRIDGGSCVIIPIPRHVPVAAAATTSASEFTEVSQSLDSKLNSRASGGGVVILGQDFITYVNSSGAGMKSLPMEHSVFLAYSPLPSYGESVIRFLLGDDRGYLRVLGVLKDEMSGIVTRLTLETVGLASIASVIEHLGPFDANETNANATIFLGSQFGDSQLLRMSNQRDEATGSFIEVVEEYTNLGPVVDFDVVDVDRKGQCQVVTCSGVGADGSIRVIRNGIGIHEQADVEIPGIKGMWNLRQSFEDAYDKYLVQSFIGETRVLAITDDEMEETHINGFDADIATLYAGDVVQNCLVQVTLSRVILVDSRTHSMLDTWSPSAPCSSDAASQDGVDDESRITVATGNASGQILVALRGGVLLYLTVVRVEGSHRLLQMGMTKLDQEISCLDASPFVEEAGSVDPVSKRNEKDGAAMYIDSSGRKVTHKSKLSKVANGRLPHATKKSTVVAVGLWNDFTVRILELSNQNSNGDLLRELLRVDLGGETQARSLLLTVLEGSQRMLLVGLGDGQLVSCFLRHCSRPVNDGSPHDQCLNVSSRKKVSLGTQSISLSAFRNASNGNTCVFASGDRPTVVYMNNGKVLYSNIYVATSSGGDVANAGEDILNWVCPFHCELFPDCLCLASEEALRIGTIDDIQKLHVQTWKLSETPRRIAHQRSGRVIVVGCVNGGGNIEDGGIRGEVNMGNTVRFLDDTTFEEMHRVDLDPFEMILSLISCDLSNTAANLSSKLEMTAAKPSRNPCIVLGTAYAYPDEDEPTKGRILVYQTTSLNSVTNDKSTTPTSRILSNSVRQLTELHVRGGVYSLCPFLDGSLLATVNSKTNIYRFSDVDGMAELQDDPATHHGHILSLFVSSINGGNLAIVGDLMRSISLISYHENNLLEIARDYNVNWTSAIQMISEEVYLGAESFNNLFTLRRNIDSSLEEVRCRLDTQGQYHLGEMVNKFASGSLLMPAGDVESSSPVSVCSQTLYATVDGSIGAVLGVDRKNYTFFRSLERALAKEIPSVGHISHEDFRAFVAERRVHPSRGFIDGDLVESFLDLPRSLMERVVERVNIEGGWDVLDEVPDQMHVAVEKPANLSVEEVLNRVEEMSRLH